MAIDPKDSESDAPKVGILARAVPSGHGAPACHGGRAMLKLTLALRPVRSPQATLSLQAWPSEIDRLFFDGQSAPALQVQPIALVDGPVPKPDPAQAAPVPVPLLRWTADRGDATRAATLWNQLIPETESWQKVYSSLDEIDGSTFRPASGGVAGDETITCMSGNEGDIALLTKIARAAETLKLAAAAVADPADPTAPTPDEEAQTLHRLFVEAATAAFADWTDYLDALKALDAGEDAEQTIGAGGLAGQGVTSAEVNRRLRDLGLAHFEKAQDACRATQQLGANVCGPQIASELVGVLEAAAGTGTCACTHMSGDLAATYLRIITLQKDFLLANQMGQAEFSALEQSINERDDERRRPSAPPPAYEKPDAAASVGAQFEPSLAATRLFSLDETPDLGRAFRTFVDFAVDPAQLGAALTRPGTQDGDEAFFYLRLADVGLGTGSAATSGIWTLAKVRLRATAGGFAAEGFWPATREELVATMAGIPPEQSRAYLGQKDALILLGARNASGTPRYELMSVDVQSAARDAQSRAERALGLAKRARDAQDRTDWAPAEGPDRIEPSRLTSGGLSVVNFSCASDLSRQIGMARALETERCDSIALDADDLLTGRLPAYGILLEDDAKEWLPVTGRKITYDDPAIAALVEPLYCDATEAALAQAAVDRSVPLVKDYAEQSADDGPPAPKRLVTCVPEVEFQLTGDPAGVQTDLKSPVQPIDASHDLATDRTYSLSQRDDGDPLLTPPARFGEAGQIGFAAVYLGGGTLRPENLPRAFDTVAEAAIPPQPPGSPPVEGRRFLRCDPVGAPSVSIPHDEAADEERLYRSGGQPEFAYQRQTAKRVVLRSTITPGDTACDWTERCTSAIDGTFQPPIRRVVLPPVLPLETAELHGVFDAVRPHWFDVPEPQIASLYFIPPWRTDYHKLGHVHRPADGLPDLHYQAGWGGMPVLRYDVDAENDLKAIASARIDYGKSFFDEAVRWSREYEAWERTASERDETPPPPKAASGDSVFARRTRADVGIGRTVPFYPDPMASELVLRLTPAIDGSGGRIALTGTVPMVEADRYPDCHPVVIQVVPLHYGEDAVIETLDGFQTVEGTRCRVVEIRVPPGRSFTLDMWHRPSVSLMENWSELVDTAATLEDVRADSDNDDPQMQSCGLLGRPAPTADALRSIAERLHAALGTWPLLEVSRVTSIDIAHAPSRPIIAPDMTPASGDNEIRVRRRLETTAQSELGQEVVHEPTPLPADWFFGNPPDQDAGSKWDAAVAEATGQTVDLGGFVKVDLPSTGSVEIFAKGTAIKGGPFDDPSRTRGLDYVHRGVFPKRIDPETVLERRMRAEEIYGFEVDPHGRVRFPRGKSLWAQFRNIPELEDTVFSAKPVYLSLHALFTRTARAEAAVSGNPGSDTRVNPLMADTRARDVTVSLRCNSRFFEDFRTRSVIRNGVFYPPTPLPAEKTRQAGLRKVDLCVPASERPPKPVPAAEALAVIVNLPHIAMPATSAPTRLGGLGDFGITGGRSSSGGLGGLGKTPTVASTGTSRVARVRLWFKRPWFASGENEMVGLVLWPQADRLVRRCGLMSRQELYLRPSVADGSRGTASSLENYMALETFEDRDLAAAEQIVSRWGSDGTEAFPDGIPERDKWRHWTIPSSVFADFTHDPAAKTFEPRRRDARHVADVALPVPGKAPATDAQDADRRFLNVDLLAYTPRFDIDREEWYVDVTLDPGPMVSPFLRLCVVRYQPCAPRDLQLSEPAEAFEFQILTHRRSEVTVTPAPNAADTHVLVRCEVTGPASAIPDTQALARCEETGDAMARDALVETVMHMRLYGAENETGITRIDAELRAGSKPAGAKTSGAKWTGTERLWTGTFRLPRAALESENIDLQVHVEERAHRMSATYGGPDADEAEREALTASQPRYLCSLDVPRPACVPGKSQPEEEWTCP